MVEHGVRWTPNWTNSPCGGVLLREEKASPHGTIVQGASLKAGLGRAPNTSAAPLDVTPVEEDVTPGRRWWWELKADGGSLGNIHIRSLGSYPAAPPPFLSHHHTLSRYYFTLTFSLFDRPLQGCAGSSHSFLSFLTFSLLLSYSRQLQPSQSHTPYSLIESIQVRN